jgi:hypothetical protein
VQTLSTGSKKAAFAGAADFDAFADKSAFNTFKWIQDQGIAKRPPANG